MAGDITDTGELYSPYVGLVYMFNLIVGTGALAMPKSFATTGWLVSLLLLIFVSFMRHYHPQLCDHNLRGGGHGSCQRPTPLEEVAGPARGGR